MLSADLPQVSTVAGDGEQGHWDGAAAQTQFNCPSGLALLPDGRVLVADFSNRRIRVLDERTRNWVLLQAVEKLPLSHSAARHRSKAPLPPL